MPVCIVDVVVGCCRGGSRKGGFTYLSEVGVEGMILEFVLGQIEDSLHATSDFSQLERIHTRSRQNIDKHNHGLFFGLCNRPHFAGYLHRKKILEREDLEEGA